VLDPATIETVAGVTVMLVSVGPPPAVTVRVAVPEMLPEVAVIVVVPAATPLASPEPLTLAAPVLLVHVTVVVQLEFELSE
jgi:hypothetical protein